jgi:MFS family permease
VRCSRRPAPVTDSHVTAVSVSLDSKFIPHICTFRKYTNHCLTCRWAGNAVLTYFLGAVLDTAGYHKAVEQANINLGYSGFQFVFALIGSAFVDKFGRRRLMLTGMAGCAVVWVGMTTASGLFNESEDQSAAKATVAMIFMFGAVFSFCITPLQALYPVEVLSFEMRAKGMAFSSLATPVVCSTSSLGPSLWRTLDGRPTSYLFCGVHVKLPLSGGSSQKPRIALSVFSNLKHFDIY